MEKGLHSDMLSGQYRERVVVEAPLFFAVPFFLFLIL